MTPNIDAAYVATPLHDEQCRSESPLHPHHELVSVMATIDEVRAQLARQH